jgi:hypothetical protein
MGESNHSRRWVSLGSIFSFVIGALFGGGSIWQWQQVKLAKSNTIQEAHYRIYENFTSYIKIYDEFYRPYIDDVCLGREDERTHNAVTRMNLFRDAILANEKNLAHLEGRNERAIFVADRPCPPKDLRITRIRE